MSLDIKKLRPLHDRVIIKRKAQETETASGLLIPESAAEKPDQGHVVAVGPGKRDDNGKIVPLEVRVNDHVYFGKYAGQTIKLCGEEMLILREEDIVAVGEV
jgi:chaperonin GroES